MLEVEFNKTEPFITGNLRGERRKGNIVGRIFRNVG